MRNVGLEADTPLLPEKAESFFWKAGKIGCLLIHGYTGTPWALRKLGELLFEKQITVLAPMLPGHGTSPDELADTKYSEWLESISNAYKALRNSCDRIIAAGLSVGGALAASLAADNELDGLILFSPAYRLRARETFVVPLVKPFLKHKMKENVHLEHGYITSEMGYNCYPLRGTAEVIKLLRKVRRKVPAIECPVLLLHSKCDRTIPAWNSQKYLEHLGSKNKKLTILDAPGHVITLGDDKERLEKEVIEFIESIMGKIE